MKQEMADQVKTEVMTPQKPIVTAPGPKPLMGQNPGRGGFINRGGRGGGMNRGGGGPGMGRGGRGGNRGGRGGGQGGMQNNGGDGQRPGGHGGSSMSLDQPGMPGGGNYGRGKPRSLEDRVMDKLANAFIGSTTDLPAKETAETRKFTGHCRLYVGNLPNDITEEDFVALFTPFGETSEPFINRDKSFGFVKMDYRSNAERAKNEVDQTVIRGKTIRVRYAQHGGIVKVKNLSPWVSNELLEKAMSIFGEVERAVVMVDARGKPLGEGVVEFVQKLAAQTCFKMLSDGCFFLTAAPKPVIAELVTEQDDDDGLMEKNLPKRHHEYQQQRELPPRFAEPASFEFEYGQRWKELNELEKQKIEAVKAEMKYEREKLDAQMEYAKQDAEITNLRNQLRQREQEKEERMRRQEEAMRHLEESRKREETMYRERSEQMTQQMSRREENLRQRAQENHRFLQQQGSSDGDNFAQPQPRDSGFAAGYEWEQGPPPPQMGMGDQGSFGGKFGPETGGPGLAGAGPGMGGGRQWGRGPGDRGAPDDFQAKRRRY